MSEDRLPPAQDLWSADIYTGEQQELLFPPKCFICISLFFYDFFLILELLKEDIYRETGLHVSSNLIFLLYDFFFFFWGEFSLHTNTQD